MSTIIDIADAVVAELAGGTFSQPFTPARRVLPEYELAEFKDLRVTVIPRGVEITGASRTLCQQDVQIDIGVQKKLSANANIDAEVAVMLSLAEEIMEFLRRRLLEAAPWAAWVRAANEPVYAPDHLAQQRVFTSVLTLTYRVLQ